MPFEPFDDQFDFDPVRMKYRPKERQPSIRVVPEHSRGTNLIPLREARKLQRKVLPPDDPGIQWGSLRLPSQPIPNFSIFGVVRSGKTSILRLIAQDLLPQVGPNGPRPARALVYDPKRDLTPFVVHLHQKQNNESDESLVVFTNPLDARSAAWDLAKDFDRPTYAKELANLLVPAQAHETRDSFYPRVVRLVLRAVIQSFIKTVPRAWTLRDIILATLSQGDLEQILSRTPDTGDILEELHQNKETYGNLRISVLEKLEDVWILAALWHHSGAKRFSLSDWMRDDPKTLLLTQVPDERSLMLRVNTLLFNRAGQMLLNQPEKPPIATYLFLDELGRAQKLDELPNVLAEGQSRNISFVLAAQGIELLQEVYGENVAEDLLSHCRNRAFLALSAKTAEWAAKVVGKRKDLELHESVGSGADPNRPQNNRSFQWHEQWAIMPEEFFVPVLQYTRVQPSRNVPLRGVFMSDPGFGTVPDEEIPSDVLIEQMLRPVAKVEAFEERPKEHQELPRWTDQDRVRLGLAVAMPNSTARPLSSPKPKTNPFETFKDYRFDSEG